MKPQNLTILSHLKNHQSITNLEALVVHSIPRLSAAIHDLRKDGYQITAELKRDAGGHRYTKYTLEGGNAS